MRPVASLQKRAAVPSEDAALVLEMSHRKEHSDASYSGAQWLGKSCWQATRIVWAAPISGRTRRGVKERRKAGIGHCPRADTWALVLSSALGARCFARAVPGPASSGSAWGGRVGVWVAP